MKSCERFWGEGDEKVNVTQGVSQGDDACRGVQAEGLMARLWPHTWGLAGNPRAAGFPPKEEEQAPVALRDSPLAVCHSEVPRHRCRHRAPPALPFLPFSCSVLCSREETAATRSPAAARGSGSRDFLVPRVAFLCCWDRAKQSLVRKRPYLQFRETES